MKTTSARSISISVVALAGALAAAAVAAVPAGRAGGTATVDGTAATMAYAVTTTKENLFDESKRDTVVVISDRPLGDTAADDEVGLSLRARRGELFVLALRLDGTKLVNVSVSHKGLAGIAVLPGAWFAYTPAKAPGGVSAGSLTLAKHDFDGHAYACSVQFVAAPAPAAAPARAEAEEAPAEVQPTPTLPPASTSTLDPKSLTPLLVKAMMEKDEAEAVKLVKLGADPNGRDQYGVPVLNWAVMMCQPRVVKALVDAKASLAYERAPGMTILTEAGACPEAAKILRAAGAH